MAVSSNRQGSGRGDQRRKGRASGERGGRDHGHHHGHGGHHQYHGQGKDGGGYNDPGYMGGMNPHHQSPFHLLSSTMTVTIQGLTPDVTLLQLRDRFQRYGRTLRVWRVAGNMSSMMEGADLAMITYSGVLEAMAAIRGENGTMLNGAEIKVSPCPYSAAPMSSVNPGDAKYWRCYLCHSTNRSSDETCSAYRCTYAKADSDADWEKGGGMKEVEDALAGRLATARQVKDMDAKDAAGKEAAENDAAVAEIPEEEEDGEKGNEKKEAEVEEAVREKKKGRPQVLCVLNLPSNVTEAQVKRAFTKYGTLAAVRLLPPAVEGETSMEAQVLYEDPAAMERAIEFENGQAVPGEQRVRVHRITAPFVVSVTPPEPFDIAGDEDVQKIREGLVAGMKEFGVVGEVEVGGAECTVQLFSLRSVLQAIARRHGGTFYGRAGVQVRLANSAASKWPCMHCFVINGPGRRACMNCNAERVDFADFPFLEVWTNAVLRTAKLRKEAAPPLPAGGGGGHGAPRGGQKNQRGHKNARDGKPNNNRQRSGELGGRRGGGGRDRDGNGDMDGRIPGGSLSPHEQFQPDALPPAAAPPQQPYHEFQGQKLTNDRGNVLAMLEQATQGPPPVALQGRPSPPRGGGGDDDFAFNGAAGYNGRGGGKGGPPARHAGRQGYSQPPGQ